MTDPSAAAPPPPFRPPIGDRLARLAIVLLVTVMAAPILVGLIFLAELAAYWLTGDAGQWTGYTGESLEIPIHTAWRFVIYGTAFGMAALAVRRFGSPARRRRWWIGLGIATALLLLPYINLLTLVFLAAVSFRLSL